MTSPNIVLLPDPGIRPLKTKADWRDFFHRLAPMATLVLVLVGLNQNAVALWVGVGLAAVDALLSFVNTYDGARRLVYGLGGVVQTVLLTVTALGDQLVTAIIGLVVFVLTSYLASKYAPDSTLSAAPTGPASDPRTRAPRTGPL
jgi:hypothetical protein